MKVGESCIGELLCPATHDRYMQFHPFYPEATWYYLIISAKASFLQASTGSSIVFCSSRTVAVWHHQSIEHRWGSCDILFSLTKVFSWTISICKLVCECLMELSAAVHVRGNVTVHRHSCLCTFFDCCGLPQLSCSTWPLQGADAQQSLILGARSV